MNIAKTLNELNILFSKAPIGSLAYIKNLKPGESDPTAKQCDIHLFKKTKSEWRWLEVFRDTSPVTWDLRIWRPKTRTSESIDITI